MAQQVLEGTWEEIAARSNELVGKRIRVTVEAEAPQAVVQPNMKMLEAMRAAEGIQQGMNPSPESDSVEIIRYGRSGPMYGMDYVDDL